jgi:hypothetical protein
MAFSKLATSTSATLKHASHLCGEPHIMDILSITHAILISLFKSAIGSLRHALYGSIDLQLASAERSAGNQRSGSNLSHEACSQFGPHLL